MSHVRDVMRTPLSPAPFAPVSVTVPGFDPCINYFQHRYHCIEMRTSTEGNHTAHGRGEAHDMAVWVANAETIE